MRCLVVYYSLSGTTRKIAERTAKELGADIVEVRASRYAPGFFGFMRAGYDSWRGNLPSIEGGVSPERYDLVLALSPVWAGHAATPMRAYLTQSGAKLKRASFVLTCGGWAPPRAFEELADAAGFKPEAVITLTEKDIKGSDGLPPALASYLSSLKLKQAA